MNRTSRVAGAADQVLDVQHLTAAQFALHLSQETLGVRFGASRKTVGRWESGQATPSFRTLEEIARAVYPIDAPLAAKLLASEGETLESVGIVGPAPPEQPPRPPLAPMFAVDTVVCAAAEAMSAAPQSVRPAVLAAFERAKAIGLSVEQVVSGLAQREAASALRGKPSGGDASGSRSS